MDINNENKQVSNKRKNNENGSGSHSGSVLRLKMYENYIINTKNQFINTTDIYGFQCIDIIQRNS